MSKSESDTTNWPEGIERPELPKGYKWECLDQALGLRNPDGLTHPWWIRVSWTTKSGKHRMLNTLGNFVTPQDAVSSAALIAMQHAKDKLYA